MHKEIPANAMDSFENRQKLRSAGDRFMLNVSCRYDHKMRTILKSHAVELEQYFAMKFAFVPADFRHEFFVREQSFSGSNEKNSLDALGHAEIIEICETVLVEMGHDLITGLREQVAAARAIVQEQFDKKGVKRFDPLLIAWLKFVIKIDAFAEEDEIVGVTKPESEMLADAKEGILLYFRGLFSNLFDDISKKAGKLFDELILFNCILIQNIDIDKNMDI